MSDVPFWQSKTLDEMSDAEWESLCDGCGQCCLHKLMDEDTDEIYFTNVACRQLNIKTCQCRNYERRFEFEPDCIKLTRENLPTFEWLPMTCAYRLLAEGKGLPAWHPLLTGSKAAMHGERISVRHIAVKESGDTGSWPLWRVRAFAADCETSSQARCSSLPPTQWHNQSAYRLREVTPLQNLHPAS